MIRSTECCLLALLRIPAANEARLLRCMPCSPPCLGFLPRFEHETAAFVGLPALAIRLISTGFASMQMAPRVRASRLDLRTKCSRAVPACRTHCMRCPSARHFNCVVPCSFIHTPPFSSDCAVLPSSFSSQPSLPHERKPTISHTSKANRTCTKQH
jgi:hypothetical protein